MWCWWGGCPDAQASETFLAAAYEFAHRGPRSLTVVNTYFRHARCDRKFGDQVVMAKFQARQWSGLGTIFPGVKLVFLDIHNDMVLGYFEGAVRTSNVSAQSLLECQVRHLWGDLTNPVYATVDNGGVHRVRPLAAAKSVRFAHIDKVRLSGSDTLVRSVHGDVNGCDVVIFDDMIATGGSLVKAAQAYKDRGALHVFAVATHGIFADGALSKIRDAHIEGVLVTDSHPNAVASMEGNKRFLSVYPLRPEQLAPAHGSDTGTCQ